LIARALPEQLYGELLWKGWDLRELLLFCGNFKNYYAKIPSSRNHPKKLLFYLKLSFPFEDNEQKLSSTIFKGRVGMEIFISFY